MPIKLLDDFPAKHVLDKENIFAIDNERAIHQDIRPIKLLILNLMPNKIDTEIQLLRLISKSPLQIDVDFLKMKSHVSKHTSMSHLSKFYLDFDEIYENRYDAMVITGAPLEHLTFNEVDYWEELCTIMNWSKRHIFSTVHICWGAQAGLYYHYDIDKVQYDQKLFGIYAQQVQSNHFIMNGFDDVFDTPQSRYTGIDEEKVKANDKLEILSSSPLSGMNMVMSKDARHIFILGHLEYDADTLVKEYHRDLEKGIDIQIPFDYFPENDASKEPICTWRAHANLFYHNWLNYVYQQTPYDLDILEKMPF
ncbi:homoserine O-succinyltransferase [Breznakia sp. PF5-3]|uniref:homoserine O-succinyltransferase n=1 Tax=unclassified Breznakia TaxID=2623764 RepID=UPI00240660E1|nr:MULTISPECIES: homoserine O-succinyltransferase [unclassified Breznakia]MDF9824101.1 homoserine O-succinyltransferase [Breznakia sp. PM6-1]MDF9834833.1 homoserine O-succinyltransferase [Breznakia sp. PF5-3]MDF9837145.1 homoserine O-succinyltransferase [Breznakia sp. PFB2-8]MDF9859070.1 homoserine O-succinyltransferase [Breznakia sp. PH5-24]